MPVTVTNVSRTPVSIILDQPAFLNRESGWQRATAKFGNTIPGSNDRVVDEVRRSHPGVLILQPGESATDVHPAIRKCSQVAGLLASKSIAISDDVPAKAAEEAPKKPSKAPPSYEKPRAKGEEKV